MGCDTDDEQFHPANLRLKQSTRRNKYLKGGAHRCPERAFMKGAHESKPAKASPRRQSGSCAASDLARATNHVFHSFTTAVTRCSTPKIKKYHALDKYHAHSLGRSPVSVRGLDHRHRELLLETKDMGANRVEPSRWGMGY